MKLKQLFADDNAVSPVIGVILMVAITVILAAVIGTFVLGLGDQLQETSPTASFSTDFTDDSGGDDVLKLGHDGGDSIARSQVSVQIQNFNDEANTGPEDVSVTSDWSGSGDLTAGDSLAIDSTDDVDGGLTGNVDLNGATVKIVWTSESGDSSATLKKWSGPDA